MRGTQQHINDRTHEVGDAPILQRYVHQVISRAVKREGVCDLVSLAERSNGLFFQVSVALSLLLEPDTGQQTSYTRHYQHTTQAFQRHDERRS